MKRLGTFFLLLTVVNALSTAHADYVDDAVRSTAIELQKQLPMRVENGTVTGVVAAGRQLQYLFRLDVPTAALSNSWLIAQTARLRANVCKHRGMSDMMKLGVTYSYLYVDQMGNMIGDVLIRHADC